VKILRTIILVLASFGFLVFAIYNWQPVELLLWQNLVLETKVPMLALIAFIAGFVPMWAVHRSVTWGLNRRIRALEMSLKNTSLAHRADLTAGSSASQAAENSVEKPGKSAADGGDPLDGTDGGDGGSGGE